MGNCAVDELNIEERLKAVAETENQAEAVYRLWMSIKGGGWEQARAANSHATWHRYMKILRKAGLADADSSAGKAFEFRAARMKYKDDTEVISCNCTVKDARETLRVVLNALL